jgi:hypothetical protein
LIRILGLVEGFRLAWVMMSWPTLYDFFWNAPITVFFACSSRCASSVVFETYSLRRAISSLLWSYDGATQFSSISTAFAKTFCLRRPIWAAFGAGIGAEGSVEEDGRSKASSSSEFSPAAGTAAAPVKQQAWAFDDLDSHNISTLHILCRGDFCTWIGGHAALKDVYEAATQSSEGVPANDQDRNLPTRFDRRLAWLSAQKSNLTEKISLVQPQHEWLTPLCLWRLGWVVFDEKLQGFQLLKTVLLLQIHIYLHHAIDYLCKPNEWILGFFDAHFC